MSYFILFKDCFLPQVKLMYSVNRNFAKNLFKSKLYLGSSGKAQEFTGTKETTEEAHKKGLMSIEDALNILECEKDYTPERVQERYERLLKINDPANGGSFFLQCKIIGARKTLLGSIQKGEEPQEEKPQEEKPQEEKPDK